MALLSPGIQIYESTVTPPATVAAAENGVATLGFSTRGPVNKLVRLTSVSDFNKIFGDPITEFSYAHILAQSVLATGTDVYFMRIADKNTAAEANCPVVITADTIENARVAIVNADGVLPNTSGYFVIPTTETEKASLTITFESTAPVTTDPIEMLNTINFAGLGENQRVFYVETSKVREAILAKLGTKYDVAVADEVDTARGLRYKSGLIILAKNTEDDIPEITISVSCDGAAVETDIPCVKTEGTFDEIALHDKTTLPSAETIASLSSFYFAAKDPGSSMNGARITKTTVTPAVGDTTWTISVVDKNGVTLETITKIDPANFIKEMEKSEWIELDIDGTVENMESLKDGTWELGFGQLLPDGTNWEIDSLPITEGADGYPTVDFDGKSQYNEGQAIRLYVEGLGSDDFVNTDEYSFSILATPGIQATLVQNAGIGVCTTRGDAIYLADVPWDFCEDKYGIDDAIDWANENAAFQTSYCAIYYGWFAQTNPYATDSSIFCPASCYVAPKMVALDASAGEFFAPAGITRGGIVCSDWTYSPDQKDRDKLVGNNNVINPISYSNTRGVVIMSQVTTDRTTSPLNRVGIRRMTNAIKRRLRNELVTILFEPNNEVSSAKARNIVDGIMGALRSKDCVESYNINVVPGTGADRNVLNIYLSYAPYGLIEKIYVYLSITDTGNVTVTEAVA